MYTRQRFVRLAFVSAATSLIAHGCTKPPQQVAAPVASATTTTMGCHADAECGAGGAGFCVDGNCLQCRAGVDCAAGETCQGGRCEAGPAHTASASMTVFEHCRKVTSTEARIRFDFDSVELTEDARAALEDYVECLASHSGVELVLEGHCDERGTQEYNLALGDRRASTVRDYMRRLGVPDEALRTLSKGENAPLCDDATEACWAANRRVEWVAPSNALSAAREAP